MASVRRQPKGAHTRSTGARRARCCLLAQARASGSTAHHAWPRRTSAAHQTSRAASTGSVHAWSTWVRVPGARTRTAAAAAARPVQRPASAQRPARRTRVQSEEHPPDVTRHPAPGRGEHRHPRQVREEVLHPRRAGPLLRVDVVAPGDGVGALLEHDPHVDPRSAVADDRHRRHRGVGDRRGREGRGRGQAVGEQEQCGAGDPTHREHGERRREPAAAQVREERHGEGEDDRAEHHGRRQPARHLERRSPDEPHGEQEGGHREGQEDGDAEADDAPLEHPEPGQPGGAEDEGGDDGPGSGTRAARRGLSHRRARRPRRRSRASRRCA